MLTFCHFHSHKQAMAAASFHTRGTQGYAVEWSPYVAGRCAVVSAQHYGIQGAGYLTIMHVPPPRQMGPTKSTIQAETTYAEPIIACITTLTRSGERGPMACLT